MKKLRPWHVLLGLVVLVAMATGGYWLAKRAARQAAKNPPPAVSERLLKSAYYNLDIVSYAGQFPRPLVRGGGISRIGDRYLLGTGDGRFYLFGWGDDGRKLEITALPYRAPMNPEEFAAAFGFTFGQQRKPLDEDTTGVEEVQTWRFRMADVFVLERGEQITIFASHHFWKADTRCFVVRVSALEGSRAAIMQGTAGPAWRTVFESQPCVPLEGPLRKRGGNPFAGMEVGGRMAMTDDDTLLVTLGDHGFAGRDTQQVFAQDPAASYGKIMQLHPATGTSEIYSMGHRNPQGLYFDSHGVLWSTEHGPQGGDELNRIVKGANHGWPLVTYGTDYNSLTWPLNAHPGHHDGYESPVYSWLPAIGVSSLIRIERSLFPAWKDDLLVSSLAVRSLFRLRLRDGNVVLVEPLAVDRRIRDLLETPEGRIVLWTDDATLETIEPATGTRSELQFANLCSGCHKAHDGKTHGIGPDLGGVIGRRIGSARGYEEYSTVLRALSGSWTEQRLDEFLTDPQRFAPGTTMAIPGIADAATRAAVIKHLQTAEE